MRHPSIGVAGGGVSSQRITGIADHAGMKRGVVLPSSPHPNSVRVPHVRTSVRRSTKTGRSPIKGLSFLFSVNTQSLV